ncbi:MULTISPECIES: DUF4123 domain-containing protein [Chromobacterium]|uniref:DUF4123 domain-containing protein n=2 Tax=Chromobacterium TaxID=535 RepID=A0ABS3GSN2_9NEIS|nr:MULTISPECIES: DUF4123 domain-containing protein [Chromobacterium]AXT46079.1 DUF4123 domain-containing protein [Chromobacterium rhizoryzae]MBK0416935.1 DUF4123 domain-containing protein [Chromobacterium haemolyticum]MBO0418067.1 DUF4123 domain-containing protein [Chromobacterium haemolyticum]MBO0501328.1 DUF4123 domain-containing protein [Chromobacterium haemolyticum]MDH0344661.1 DUF4123 domain-containing protein [Chromobacterium haemolyticum]
MSSSQTPASQATPFRAITQQHVAPFLDLLLDPVADSGNWQQRIAMIQPPLECLRLFDDTPLSDLRQDSPLLVRVWLNQSEHCDWLESTLNLLWQQPQWIVLFSSSSQPALAAHLRRFLTVKLDGGGLTLLRYYDPRLLRIVVNTLTPAQGAALGQRIDLWLWRNRDGELERWTAPSDHPAPLPSSHQPLPLDSAQRVQLESYVEAHASLIQLQSLEPARATQSQEQLLDELARLNRQADVESRWNSVERMEWIRRHLPEITATT